MAGLDPAISLLLLTDARLKAVHEGLD